MAQITKNNQAISEQIIKNNKASSDFQMPAMFSTIKTEGPPKKQK